MCCLLLHCSENYRSSLKLNSRSVTDFYKGHHSFSHQYFTTVLGLTLSNFICTQLRENLSLSQCVSPSPSLLSPCQCQTDTQRSVNVRAVCHKWIINDDTLKSHFQNQVPVKQYTEWRRHVIERLYVFRENCRNVCSLTLIMFSCNSRWRICLWQGCICLCCV